MKSFRISRRHLLRGAGSLGIALPLLDVMEPLRDAHAQMAGGVAKRFIVVYQQTGFIYSQWKPSGSTTSFTLSPTLSALEPLKSKIVVVDGLTNQAAIDGIGDDHGKGMGTMLTATPLAGSTNALIAGGISIDQEIANHIGTTTKFKSLEFGVQSGSGNITNYSSHSASGKPNPMTDDPATMYSRVFGSFTGPSPSSTTTGPDPALAKLMSERKSILDAVGGSYESLVNGGRISAADKDKLNAHAQQIRELEKTLLVDPSASQAATAVGCAKPGAPMSINAKQGSNFPTVGKLQMDLLHMAHTCDLTRVSVLQFSRESADPVYSWITGQNITRGHHAISHDADSSSTSQTQLAAIDKWHTEQFAYLVGKLDATKEGAATMLDNSVVLLVNGLAKGNSHSHGPTPPQPVVVAGGGGGTLKTGRYYVVPKETKTNDLYISCLNAMGIMATTFGEPSYCKGPLADL